MMKPAQLGIFVLALCSVRVTLPQTDQARLIGMVTDTTGAVVPAAKVTIRSERSGEERTLTSNGQGYYIVNSLPPASYSVIGEAPGLGPTQYKEILVQVGQVRTLNLVLRPSSLQQEVTVSGGELAAVDPSSARMGANVGERETSQLPLNGRQLSTLYLLAPGAVTSGSGTFDNIRFSGRSNQQNIIRYDGIEGTSIIDASPLNLNGQTSSFFRLQSSLENVQEFRVDSSNYPAEYGTGTGGQISVITKSGSNQVHGGLFEYFRNDKLDARNFFDQQKAPLRLNQFGGSVGGPIAKDKAFFFASFERLRQRIQVPFREAVPSATARARAVPAIQPLLAAYPLGVAHTDNPDLDVAARDGSQEVNEDSGGIRFDYRLNNRYIAYLRYFRDQGDSFQPLGVTGNGIQISAAPQNAVFNLQQIFRPNLINESKFGLNYYKTRAYGRAPSVPGVDMSALSLVITGSVALPGISSQGASAGVAVPGGLVRSNSATNGRGQPYTNYSLSFVDNLSWIKGSHSSKFGVEVRPLRLYTDRQGGTTYSFSNLDDFLANRPLQIQFLGDVSAPSPFNNGATGTRLGKQVYYIFYAQDEWKIRPNLTMNYGLRYEYYTVLHEDRNLDIVMDTVKGVLLPPDTPFYRSSKRNFAPRLAFSWAPTRLREKTVLRIGGGYYYGPGQTEDQIQPIESDRVSTTLPPGSSFPINPAQIIARYDINSPTLRFQPRAYLPGMMIPERVLSYTFSVQQRLPLETVLTAAYVGSQGRNLFLRSFTNLITGVSTNPTTGAAIVTRQFGDRFAEIDVKTGGGRDSYNALQTTVNRHFSKGLTIGSQWTWAHSIGNSGGSNEAITVQNPYDYNIDRGNNIFDIRQSANVTVLYELPVGKGRRFLGAVSKTADLLLGGWELGSVVNARAGLPIDVLVTRPDVVYRDNRTEAIVNNPILVNGAPVTTAVLNTPGGGASRQVRRPDLVSGVDVFLHDGEKTHYLNPAAFVIPAPGTYGNLSRNSLPGPGLAQWDFTLHKRFVITESKNLELRSEFYNLLNRANFGNPPAALANAVGTGANQLQPGQPFTRAAAGGVFGTITSTVDRTVGLGNNRQIQLSLRFNF